MIFKGRPAIPRPGGGAIKCMFCDKIGSIDVTIGSFSVKVDRQHVDMALDTYLNMVDRERNRFRDTLNARRAKIKEEKDGGV